MADEHNIELTPDINAEGVVKSAKRLRSAIQSIFDGSEGKQLDSRLQSMQNKMGQIVKKSQEVEKAIEGMAGTQVPTEQYAELQKALDDSSKKFDTIRNKMLRFEELGGDVSSKQYQGWAYDLEQVELNIDGIKTQMSELQQWGEAFIPAETTEEYQKLISQQEQLNNQMRIYTESWNESIARQDQMTEGAALRAQRQELSGMNKAVTSLSSTLRGIGRIIPGVSTRGLMATSMIVKGISKLSSLTKKDLVAAINTVKSAFMKLFAVIQANPVVAIITAILAAVVALVKTLKKSLAATKKELEQIAKVLSKSIKKTLSDTANLAAMLGRSFFGFYSSGLRLTIRGVNNLINKLKSLQSTITEGLKSMAQWNNGTNNVNKALSNLTSSLEYVKTSLATAFAPIVEVIEPMLTRLLDLLAEVITAVGMFTAKLAGATSFQKAIRQQKDYAKSIAGVGSAADETKQKLASYDKLQVISQDNSSGGGSVASMFEEVSLQDFELPEWLTDLFNLGQKVGTKLRDVLNSIPWESVQNGANKAARGIADFINGMMSVSGLGEAIGGTLGNILNTFTTFINTLMTKVDGKRIGKQLRGIFDSFLEITDFKSLGAIFFNAVNGFTDLLIGVFSDPGLGSKLGTKLSEFIASAFGNINWTNISKAVSDVFNTIGELANSLITPENFGLLTKSFGTLINELIFAVSNFVATADWDQFGESIATAINDFFSKVNWDFSGETLSNFAKNLLDMVLKAVNRVDWDQVGDALVDFISNIDWKGIAKKAKEISSRLREGLQAIWKDLADSKAFDDMIDLVVDFLKEKKNWEKAFKRIKNEVIRRVFVDKIISALKNFFRVEEFMEVFEGAKEAFKEGGAHIIEGIGLGIFGALDLLFGWAVSIFEAFWNGICNVFGIHSPAESMKPVGENIVLGILDGFGLVDFAGKMSEWWNNSVAPWFTLQKWSDLANNVLNALTIKADEIKLKLSEKWVAVRDKTLEIFSDLGEKLKTPINGIISIVEGLINKIISGINSLTSKLNSVGFDVKNPFNGETYSLGFNIPQLNELSIPRLAQGAVIPPNKEFAAILGDQKSGTNIETPLATMVQAFKQAMSEMGGSKEPIILQLNGRTVAQVVWDEEAKRYKQAGRYQTT